MSIAFKEWQAICHFLGNGCQSILFRKRGIGENKFAFRHSEFFLFPTGYHQQLEKIRFDDNDRELSEGTDDKRVVIRYRATVEWSKALFDWDTVERLYPFHRWINQELLDRFNYGGVQSINLAFVRIYRLEPKWNLVNLADYGGCRSWLTLPNPPGNLHFDAVIDDPANTSLSTQIKRLIEP